MLRQSSLLRAGAWRQSSCDLTRMGRSHVVTGDAIYRRHYQEIRDIRDGVSSANQTNAIYAGSFDRSNLASFAARIKLKAHWDVSHAPAPGYPLTGGSLFAGE